MLHLAKIGSGLTTIAKSGANFAIQNPEIIQGAFSSLSSRMPENSRFTEFSPIIGKTIPMALKALDISNITK